MDDYNGLLYKYKCLFIMDYIECVIIINNNMKTIECDEHKMTKKYLVCLNIKCRDRLLCWSCH